MARGPVDIRKRIEKQRQKIFELTDELEQAKEAFEKLQGGAERTAEKRTSGSL